MLDFKTIYDKYWAELVYYGYKKIQDKQAAQDLVQDLFIHSLDKIKEFPQETDLRYYLFCSLRWRCVDYLNKVQTHDERLTDCVGIETEDYDLLETDLVSLIYKHMAGLPPVRLRIFTMLFLEGKKLLEVADILHLSINTVKSQRGKAILQLRRYLT